MIADPTKDSYMQYLIDIGQVIHTPEGIRQNMRVPYHSPESLKNGFKDWQKRKEKTG
ncbi:MAG: hypothetical protein U0518_04575 [Candidatus Gracilibacteria bacterium]